MTHFVTVVVAALTLVASAAQPALAKKSGPKKGPHEFKENRTGKAGRGRGVKASKIEPTRTEAALKFTVVDKDKGPIPGIVILLSTPKAKKTYVTDETDAKGYAEVLVPVGKTYELVYLSLGRRKISAKIPVSKESRQTIKLTLRYKRFAAPKSNGRVIMPRFVLQGVQFDTGKATIRKDSFPRLERVVDFLKYKKSARIEISGHTDNVGNARRNKALSKRRAQACRKYLVTRDIDGSRVRAVGLGDKRPIASNDTAEGRQRNRRIEASEL